MEDPIKLREEIHQLNDAIKILRNTLELNEERLSQYQASGPLGYYYELNRVSNEFTNYLKGVKIKDLMEEEEKGKGLDRLLKLIAANTSNVETLQNLKQLINATGEEEKDKENNRVPGRDLLSEIQIKRST